MHRFLALIFFAVSVRVVVAETKRGKLQVLRAFYQQVLPIKWFVKRELVVYRTLNMFEQSPSGTLLVADCWIPAYAADIIRDALEEGRTTANATDAQGAGHRIALVSVALEEPRSINSIFDAKGSACPFPILSSVCPFLPDPVGN